MKEPKVLIYDIETSLCLLSAFALGKQVVRHNQLLSGYFSRTHVMCITYKWEHEDKAKILTWGKSEEDERRMLERFDQEIKKADIVIGKNSDRFDNKHLNAQRLFMGNDPMPQWIKYTDDLEKQMRKHFNLQSYSLDYFSEQLGLGGKIKMSFPDWEDMMQYRLVQLCPDITSDVTKLLFNRSKTEITKLGKAASKKMFEYGIKDTEDTAALWEFVKDHFEPRLNQSAYHGDLRCKHCGSTNIKKNGTRVAGKTKYQEFYCNAHGGYAGRAPLKKDKTISAGVKLG